MSYIDSHVRRCRRLTRAPPSPAPTAVVAWRRALLKAAKTLRETGELPAMVREEGLPWGALKGAEFKLDAGQNWKEFLPIEPQFKA